MHCRHAVARILQRLSGIRVGGITRREKYPVFRNSWLLIGRFILPQPVNRRHEAASQNDGHVEESPHGGPYRSDAVSLEQLIRGVTQRIKINFP